MYCPTASYLGIILLYPCQDSYIIYVNYNGDLIQPMSNSLLERETIMNGENMSKVQACEPSGNM